MRGSSTCVQDNALCQPSMPITQVASVMQRARRDESPLSRWHTLRFSICFTAGRGGRPTYNIFHLPVTDS